MRLSDYDLKLCILHFLANKFPYMTDIQMNRVLINVKNKYPFLQLTDQSCDINCFNYILDECTIVTKKRKKIITLIRIIGILSLLLRDSEKRVWAYPDGSAFKELCNKYNKI